MVEGAPDAGATARNSARHVAPHVAWIALGSNLDDPARRVTAAMDQIGGLPDTRLLARSSLYETRPWGGIQQPDFINAVVKIGTRLAPHALLEALLAIEAEQGRRRDLEKRWGPRRLDLDLLLYDELSMDSEGLTLPHPRLHERAFVLAPLLELEPGLTVPGHGPVARLLAAVGTGGIVRLEAMES